MRIAGVGVLLVLAGCAPSDPEQLVDDTVTDTASVGAAGAGPALPGGAMGPAADTSLAGVRWVLTEVRGTPARSGETPERSAYMELSASEGRVSGNASCNRFSGPYSLAGDSIAFGALISTKMACIDSALTAQETAFLSALEQTRTWRMAGDTLVFASDSGALARFRAAD